MFLKCLRFVNFFGELEGFYKICTYSKNLFFMNYKNHVIFRSNYIKWNIWIII